MLDGKCLEFEKQQTFIRKELLKSDAENIKVQKTMKTKVIGTITKRIVNEEGICRPMYHVGDDVVPQ